MTNSVPLPPRGCCQYNSRFDHESDDVSSLGIFNQQNTTSSWYLLTPDHTPARFKVNIARLRVCNDGSRCLQTVRKLTVGGMRGERHERELSQQQSMPQRRGISLPTLPST
ncbi:hypothetical protein BDM02DRAFT_3111316 [Thelephora ganbajun]|uniref:Uncharacterized protein n=1 Tax=Thelephora ganbajun TaxID=370292 RepID=A0ACB6ZPD7_THEGA|nr:hypothetical protein BDM02DRAFT_3111316 [Thelephora ganbajun]